MTFLRIIRLSFLLPILLVFVACGEKTPLEKAKVDYLRACATCHGADGSGRGSLGNPLVDNEFLRTSSDEEVLALLKAGRTPSDPANTTGTPMPPRGGDPRLTDEDLVQIVLYLRTFSR